MAPAQRVRGGLRRRVGEHRQDEPLGVPEGVAVVAGAGQALGRDRALLGAGAGLQRVEEREAHRLLQLGVALELDVGAAPRSRRGTRAGRASSPSQPVCRAAASAATTWSRSADSERRLDQPYARNLTTRSRSPGASSVATVTRPTSGPLSVAASIPSAPSTTWSMPAAMRSLLCLRRCTSTALASRSKKLSETSGASSDSGGPRIVGRRRAPARSRRAPTARRRAAGSRAARPRRAIAATARWTKETSRVERTRTLAPAGDSHSTARSQHAGAQVEHALVRAQPPVADVERLVVDEQADDLAVRDVDDRLARLGIAVAGLGVGQRAQLVERVQVRPRQAERLALVEVPAQADVPVREREHRFGLGEHVEVEPRLAHGPRLDREGGMRDHGRSSSSARSETTTSAPCCAQRVRLADPVDADDEPEARRPARPRRRRARPRTPPPAALPPRARARRRGTCPARACPPDAPAARRRRRCAPRRGPSMPAAASTSWQFALDETTARRSPASRAART